MRKPRKQKLWKDKFQIKDITNKELCKIEDDLYVMLKDYRKKNNLSKITQKNLETFLMNNGLYKGSFYCEPNVVNRVLNLNLEDVHMDLTTLDKTNHGDNYWTYGQNDFKKIFVIETNKQKAVVGFTYTDIMMDVIIDTIDIEHLCFEGNLCQCIYDFVEEKYTNF